MITEYPPVLRDRRVLLEPSSNLSEWNRDPPMDRAATRTLLLGGMMLGGYLRLSDQRKRRCLGVF